MANKHRGEVDICLDGRTYRMCLTLGALAELETAFGDEDMLALAQRFGDGRLSSRDAIRILGAGLRGAGEDLSDDAVAQMRCQGGAAGYIAAVAELLEATFSAETPPTSTKPPETRPKAHREVCPTDPFTSPFHGTT